MANLVKTKKTELKCDEVISRGIQFFSNGNWRCQSQSERTATFVGRASIPWFLILLTIIAFLFFIIPGIIMYLMVIRKMYGFQNLVISTRTNPDGCEVDITYPKQAKKLVNRFLASLPAKEISTSTAEA
jgi:hypothetical protein